MHAEGSKSSSTQRSFLLNPKAVMVGLTLLALNTTGCLDQPTNYYAAIQDACVAPFPSRENLDAEINTENFSSWNPDPECFLALKTLIEPKLQGFDDTWQARLALQRLLEALYFLIKYPLQMNAQHPSRAHVFTAQDNTPIFADFGTLPCFLFPNTASNLCPNFSDQSGGPGSPSRPEAQAEIFNFILRTTRTFNFINRIEDNIASHAMVYRETNLYFSFNDYHTSPASRLGTLIHESLHGTANEHITCENDFFEDLLFSDGNCDHEISGANGAGAFYLALLKQSTQQNTHALSDEDRYNVDRFIAEWLGRVTALTPTVEAALNQVLIDQGWEHLRLTGNKP